MTFFGTPSLNMPPEDRFRLQHMLEAARAAVDFIGGRDRSDFEKDLALVFAVTRAIEVMGEAASKVTTATRSADTNIPWKEVVAMRNRLIHAYFDIDREILWRTVRDELPPLIARLRDLLVRDHN
jgi:uncharacterized protein with HEPN domain